jgi:hypothetical protein
MAYFCGVVEALCPKTQGHTLIIALIEAHPFGAGVI